MRQPRKRKHNKGDNRESEEKHFPQQDSNADYLHREASEYIMAIGFILEWMRVRESSAREVLLPLVFMIFKNLINCFVEMRGLCLLTRFMQTVRRNGGCEEKVYCDIGQSLS